MEWLKAMLFALITVIIFRLLLFEAFTIPSPSMEKTILTGDYIIVSKYTYGARLPFTPVSLPFVHQRVPYTESTKSYLDWITLPYYRVGGAPSIKNNDIVVFNYPMQTDRPIDQRIYYIKRCVAIAGDSLELRGGQVYINGNYADLPEKLQFNYKVLTDNDSLDKASLEKLNLVQGGKMHNKGGYWFNLDEEHAKKMKLIPHVTSVTPMIEKKGSYNDYVFPESENFFWNVDFMGPLYIPKAGDSVSISMKNLPLYKRIITVYENNELEVINDSLIINNSYATSYTFKMNYYFMMGDSRHSSADSRFWGFVPENHVVGKAKMILLSIDKSKEQINIRWDRFFKQIE